MDLLQVVDCPKVENDVYWVRINTNRTSHPHVTITRRGGAIGGYGVLTIGKSQSRTIDNTDRWTIKSVGVLRRK